MKRYNIVKPDQILNMDETGLSLSELPNYTWAKRGKKRKRRRRRREKEKEKRKRKNS